MKIRTGTGETFDAALTTEHSASSYGVPVLLVGGLPLGPNETFGLELIEATDEERIALRRAGFQLVGLDAPDSEPAWSIWCIENRASGAMMGLFEGASAQQAIAAMLADAGCDDPPDSDLFAVDVLLAMRIAEHVDGLRSYVDGMLEALGWRPTCGENPAATWASMARTLGDPLLARMLAAARARLAQLSGAGGSV